MTSGASPGQHNVASPCWVGTPRRQPKSRCGPGGDCHLSKRHQFCQLPATSRTDRRGAQCSLRRPKSCGSTCHVKEFHKPPFSSTLRTCLSIAGTRQLIILRFRVGFIRLGAGTRLRVVDRVLHLFSTRSVDIDVTTQLPWATCVRTLRMRRHLLVTVQKARADWSPQVKTLLRPLPQTWWRVVVSRGNNFFRSVRTTCLIKRC